MVHWCMGVCDDKTTRAFRLVAILFQDGGRVHNGGFKGK